MHDPRYLPGYITTYILDATPGRHTQGGDPMPMPGQKLREYDTRSTNPHDRADVQKQMADVIHVMNASGVCLFGYLSYEWPFIPDFMEAATGWEWPMATVRKTGERIGTMRHLFNLREGINPLEYSVPGRAVGSPPQTTGPLEGRTVDYQTMVREYLEYIDWDPVTTVPSLAKLAELGLGDLAPIFHQA
jgi:aldehyde:ferredoxin oxidoreductase